MDQNVRQAVPYFRVADMAASLRFYQDGLGFRMDQSWMDDGALRWCWLSLDGAAVMLQSATEPPAGRPGEGVTIYFICEDALAIFHGARARGLKPDRPFVGNGMWVVGFSDPDGYRLEFESPTDVPEETRYEER